MKLAAELRTETGTSASRRARRQGLIPVSMYGKEGEAKSLLINARDFEAILRKEGSNAVFDLDLDGQTQRVWVKDYEKAALSNDFYSVDLEAISANQKLEVEIPLVIVNEETVKVGIVETVMNTILVEAPASDIPQAIEFDVTGMEIGDSKAVSDLEVPANVTILAEEDQTVISVSAPTEEPEEDEETEDEVAEPEVIGEDAEEEAEDEE